MIPSDFVTLAKSLSEIPAPTAIPKLELCSIHVAVGPEA